MKWICWPERRSHEGCAEYAPVDHTCLEVGNWADALEAGRWKSKQVGLVYRGMTVQVVIFTAAAPLAAWGHDILTKDGKIAPTSPAAVEALEFFQNITCRERSAPSRETDGYEGDAAGHLNTGRLGTMTVSHDNLQRLRQYGWAFDFVPPPKQKTSASLLNAEQICVLQHGKQRDGAWEYLKFAASSDEQVQMSKAFGNAPPFKSTFDAFVRDAEAFKDIKGARYMADIMKIARPLPIELTTKFSDLQRLWEQQVISAPILNKCDGSSARDGYDRFVREANQFMV